MFHFVFRSHMHVLNRKFVFSIETIASLLLGGVFLYGCTNSDPKIQLLTIAKAVERCDGVDEDDDGKIDEGFSIGDECTTYEIGESLLECPETPGTIQCQPGINTRAFCTPPEGSFAIDPDEKCDGFDNNCNGQVDEGNTCREENVGDLFNCDSQAEGLSCQTFCVGGYRNCDAGEETTYYSCETNVSIDKNNCGACGKSCQLDCNEGRCSFPYQITAGDAHTCALFKFEASQQGLGYVVCWGDNSQGQLGIPQTSETSTFSHVPAKVSGKIGDAANPVVKQISAGGNHTCALTASTDASSDNDLDEVWCWGSNNSGESSPGVVDNSVFQPVKLPIYSNSLLDEEDSATIKIASGKRHSCLLAQQQLNIPGANPFNKVFCWGDNASLQLGNQNPDFSEISDARLIREFEDNGFTFIQAANYQLSLGGEHGCVYSFPRGAYDQDDGLLCWGNSDYFGGGIPQGSLISTASPLELFPTGAALNVSSLSLGGQHSCFSKNRPALGQDVAPEDGLYCVGSNECLQLGNEDPEETGFVLVSNDERDFLSAPQFLAAGNLFTCAVVNNAGSQVYCWGNNDHQQLGVSLEEILPGSIEPVPPGVGIPLDSIDPEYREIALEFDSDEPQSGCSITFAEPQPIAMNPENPAADLPNVFDISAGRNHVCMITADIGRNSDKAIRCWGNNACGQLGIDAPVSPEEDCNPNVPRYSSYQAEQVSFE